MAGTKIQTAIWYRIVLNQIQCLAGFSIIILAVENH